MSSWRCVALTTWKQSRGKTSAPNSGECWKIPLQSTLVTNCINSEKRRICNYMRWVQQTASAALKKQDPEKKIEGKETVSVKIDILHVCICYSWVPPGYGKWQWQAIRKFALRKRKYFIFQRDWATIFLCAAWFTIFKDMYLLWIQRHELDLEQFIWILAGMYRKQRETWCNWF